MLGGLHFVPVVQTQAPLHVIAPACNSTLIVAAGLVSNLFKQKLHGQPGLASSMIMAEKEMMSTSHSLRRSFLTISYLTKAVLAHPPERIFWPCVIHEVKTKGRCTGVELMEQTSRSQTLATLRYSCCCEERNVHVCHVSFMACGHAQI